MYWLNALPRPRSFVMRQNDRRLGRDQEMDG
jgi:hypothetical protein